MIAMSHEVKSVDGENVGLTWSVRVQGDAALSGLVKVITPGGTANSAEPLVFVP